LEDIVKNKVNNTPAYDSLTELGLRPVSQVFNQIRYWSALDDPEEEKWDYISHYTRTERREMGIGAAPSFNIRPVIAAMLIVLLLVGVGVGGWLAWPYVKDKLGGTGTSNRQITAVTGYMVRLGNRDLGVVQDKDGMEAFVTSWLEQQNAAAQEGVTYVIAQNIEYAELTVDSHYCATLEDVESAFVKHATLTIAQ
jgi:hypothetical protein